MADEIRVNRVQPQSASGMQQPAMMKNDNMMMQDEMMTQKNSKAPWIILAVIVVVIVVLGFLFRDKLFKGKGAATTASQSSGYQAVFLSNGQVYFGKVSNPMGDYVTLDDIYYLQVTNPAPALQGAGATQAPAQPQVSLVKLGNELHGPVDEMHISRTQVLFYEDLKTDGQVVKAIQQYKANPTGGAAPVK